jgi:glycosyltransferase involved in cell wall biosynthesis
MKILHITKKYSNLIGGDTIVVKNLRKYQEKNNDEVYILTSNNDTILNKPNLYKFGLKIKDNELDVINIKRIISLISLFFYSFKLLKQVKPDVIHCHSIDMGFAVGSASNLYGIPQIATFHNGFYSIKNTFPVRSILERLFIRLSGFKKIITVNPQDTTYIRNENILYIANGVNTDIFNPKNKIANAVVTILFVGRIVEVKGLHYLISAINEINNRGYKVKLKIIGEGDKKAELQKQIADLHIENVQFLDDCSQKQLAQHYSKADMLVLPSVKQEGFGLVILEALASGTPVVTTNVSGLASYIKSYNCGIVVPERNSGELANAIIKLIKNKGLVKQFNRNGKELIKKEFSWPQIAKQTNEVYRSVINE